MNDRAEIEVLFDVAVLGKQVDSFMASDVGKFVLNRARIECDTAMDTLKSVDPHDVKSILVLQNDIRRAESFKEWLEESVRAGIKATLVLEDREDD